MDQSAVTATIQALVADGLLAQSEYLAIGQERIDAIVKAMTFAGIDRHMELARLAVDETHMGIYEDKVIKNLFATEYVYHSIKLDKTVANMLDWR